MLIGVLLLVGISYSNTLYSPPVIDDRAAFIDNPSVYTDNLSFASLKQVYDGQFGHTRFIPMLSFAIDHLLDQGNIVQFHLTNIMVHLLATMAVYLLVLGLTQTGIGSRCLVLLSPASFSLFVAALWSLHPVQTNAVTYLVQRMASMAAMFYFASLAGYVWARTSRSRPIQTISWGAFVLFMLCAFMSKENTATLPLAVLLIELTFISPDLGRRIIATSRRHSRLLLTLTFLLVLPLAIIKLTAIANSYGFRYFNLPERLFTELRVVVFYLSLLALPLPSRLNLGHDFPISHTFWNSPPTLLSFILLTLLVFGAIRYHHRHPLASFGILLFFLNLIIESTIIPLEIIFEHRLYLPSLGFFIALVALLDWSSRFIPVPDKKELKVIFSLLLLIICCILAIATSLRNHVWRDKLALYQDIARKSPQQPRAYSNLGMVLSGAGRHEEALIALQKAISLGKGQSEEYINAANNIVASFLIQKRYQEANDWAIKLTNDIPDTRMNYANFPLLMINLGISYRHLERFDDAFIAFMDGIKHKHPTHTILLLKSMENMLRDASTNEKGRRQLALGKEIESIYNRMSAAFLFEKDYKNAATYMAKALTIAPTNETALAIKKIWNDETGQNQRALMAISSANQPAASTSLHFKATSWLAGFFATRYTVLDHWVEPLLKKAVQLEPESIGAALRLAQWQVQNNEVDEAVKLTEHHLATKPDLAPLLEIAAKGYFVQGKNDLAATMLERLLEVYPATRDWKRYRKFILAYRGEEVEL